MGEKRDKLKTVYQLIHNRFLFSSMLPLLVIELALLVLYFSVTGFVANQYQKTLVDEANQNLSLLTNKHIESIDAQLGEIAHTAQLLQSVQQQVFSLPQQALPKHNQLELIKHNNGSYYTPKLNGSSSYYYSSDTIIGSEQLDKIQRSQLIDPLLKSIVEYNPIIVQAYFNSWDNMNQLYPYIDNVSAVFGSTLKMQDYNFYYLADAKHNPERMPVWTKAYLDPAGQGWLVSCIVPIYSDNFLEGVSGVDIPIASFINDILELNLPWGASGFLVDQDGVILAMAPEIEKLTGLDELSTHNYSRKINETVYKPEEFNISALPNAEFRGHLERIISSQQTSATIHVNGKEYLITRGQVAVTGWQVMAIVDASLLNEPVTKMEDITVQIGAMAIIAMIVFYVLFFIHVKLQAKELGGRIATPLERLSTLTATTGNFLTVNQVESSNIKEIDELGDHFNKLSKELEYRTRDLIQTETRQQLTQEKANLLEKLSNTDHLTHLSNRMYLDRLLDVEIHNFKATPRVISIILLDIDKFKRINDQFGHDIGDEVLVSVARLLENNTRGVDTCGRWGGEEFLIVCPGTPIDNASMLAEKIRVMFECHEFHPDFRCTASFGVAQLQVDETKNAWFKRVDKAMYQAKNSGRNQVVKAEE